MSGVPLLDLKTQYQTLREEILATIDAVLSSGTYVLGPRVKIFEEQIAEYCGVKHAIGVASGTDALLLALMALGVGRDDEVVLPTYTFFATAGVVHRLGARPVFVDIDPRTYNLDPAGLEAALSPRTKAVIPVHLFGQCAVMGPITDFCDGRGIPVIEDAAQALGAAYRSVKAGALGRFGCFSFYPTKNLGGYGDGGMITTDSDDLADLLRRLRVHGARPKYIHALVGVNSRLDAIQAAVLGVKLRHLDEWAAGRRAHAAFYRERFRDTPVETPIEESECHHVYNQFVIRVPNRDAVMERLKAAGIGTEVYYPLPMHLQECFRYLGHGDGDLPHSEKASRESLSIPVYPEMTDGMLETVADTILRSL